MAQDEKQAADGSADETTHLLSNPKNTQRLLRSVAQVEAGEAGNPFTKLLEQHSALQRKLDVFGTPGLEVEFDPDEAEALGCFDETALSAEDALEASTDPEVID